MNRYLSQLLVQSGVSAGDSSPLEPTRVREASLPSVGRPEDVFNQTPGAHAVNPPITEVEPNLHADAPSSTGSEAMGQSEGHSRPKRSADPVQAKRFEGEPTRSASHRQAPAVSETFGGDAPRLESPPTVQERRSTQREQGPSERPSQTPTSPAAPVTTADSDRVEQGAARERPRGLPTMPVMERVIHWIAEGSQSNVRENPIAPPHLGVAPDSEMDRSDPSPAPTPSARRLAQVSPLDRRLPGASRVKPKEDNAYRAGRESPERSQSAAPPESNWSVRIGSIRVEVEAPPVSGPPASFPLSPPGPSGSARPRGFRFRRHYLRTL